MIKRFTAVCTECGTVRNVIVPACSQAELAVDMLGEIERTRTCPYCEQEGLRELRDHVA
ncbi:hypothetical protein HM1_0217 [Heliomicrobium modesticaldum Ice1]|uniref:Uncharacterized protein n=1 Tax=Heliobacterium modesticaldum (strain ATCC 51547 / Ice1) TaxID=498761 RepID=B0TDX3_HELMI|nr:hypothetical protein [Heliomicrobium modesticaldum]ABZ82836.1 hypothetical protein HM1_0217 [Heliomicrobium modesticaldum Ice1]